MSFITPSFFLTPKDFAPYFDMAYGLFDANGEELSDPLDFRQVVGNAIRSVVITLEMAKPPEMDLVLEYGAASDQIIYAPIQPATTQDPTKPSVLKGSRRVAFRAGYRGITSLSDRYVGLYEIGTEPGKPTFGKPVNKGDIIPGYVVPDATLFVGTLLQPTVSGSENGTITVSFKLIAASGAFEKLQLGVVPKSSKSNSTYAGYFIQDAPQTTATPSKKIKELVQGTLGDILKDELENTILVDYKRIESLVSPIELYPIRFTSAFETRYEAIRRMCKAYGVSFIIDYPKANGAETWRFFPTQLKGFLDSFPQGANQAGAHPSSIPAAPPAGQSTPATAAPVGTPTTSPYAVILKYGEAVINFSFSITQSVQLGTNDGQSTITREEDGATVTYVVSSEKVERAIGNKSAADVLQFVKSEIQRDPNDFILNFCNVKTTLSAQPRLQPPVGAGGRTLTLALRHALPSLAPGALVWFDIAGERSDYFPSYVPGLYTVVKVTNKFDATKDIWSQTLECKR